MGGNEPHLVWRIALRFHTGWLMLGIGHWAFANAHIKADKQK